MIKYQCFRLRSYTHRVLAFVCSYTSILFLLTSFVFTILFMFDHASSLLEHIPNLLEFRCHINVFPAYFSFNVFELYENMVLESKILHFIS